MNNNKTIYQMAGWAILLCLLPISSAKAQQAQCGSTEPIYVFGDEVPSSQRDSIRNGINSGAQYVCSKTGVGVEGFTIYAYADLDKLISTYAQVLQLPIDTARSHWQTSTAIAGNNTIFFYTPRLFSDPPTGVTKICAHEYFHVVQNKLTNGNLIGKPDSEVPLGGPRWLIEGSAEYEGALAADAAGVNSFALAKEQYRASASTSTVPLSSMEVLAGLNAASYPLGLMACDFLAPDPQPRFSSIQSLVSFWDAIGKGKTWQQAFQMVFGESITDFYVQFEQYRSTSFPPPQTLPFAISLDSIYPSVAAIGSDYPLEAFPYIFRVTGFALNSLTPNQLGMALKRPLGIDWGLTRLGPDLIVLYFRPTVPSGIYTAALDLPDGRHTETNFTHSAASGANPVPNILTLIPNQRRAGDAGFILTVTGSNFVPGVKAQWNGADKPTRMRNNSTLELTLSGPDIATAGIATVIVFNPAPGGGTSNSLPFTITNATISGTVNYGTSATPKLVPGVTLTAIGAPSVTSVTNSTGAYTLTGLGGGPYTVTPSKTGDVTGISSLDASLVAQHAAGLITLTPNQQIAADASGNGSITAFDASLIAQTAAGIPNNGIAGTWKFAPINRSYSTLSGALTNQNFDAILVGDVSGNWTAAASLPSPAPASPIASAGVAATSAAVRVSLPRLGEAPSGRLTVPVMVGDLTGLGVTAFDFDLVYNPAVLQFQGVDADETLSYGMTIMVNKATPGRLRVVAFGSSALASSGTLLRLNFKVTGTVVNGLGLNWMRFQFNEGTPQATPASEHLRSKFQRTPRVLQPKGRGQ